MTRRQSRALKGALGNLWDAARSTSGTADSLIGGEPKPVTVQDGTVLEVDGIKVRVTGFAKRGSQVAILATTVDLSDSMGNVSRLPRGARTAWAAGE